MEEYLEAIHTLGEEGVEVIQARVAERVGRSAPSVSEMLGRLEEEGYVVRQGRRLSLTPAGEAVACRVVRRHRLAERLLVDVIGLEWHKAHLEAGRWEHVISDEVEDRLVALLGDPSTCPHGNPIPGSANRVEADLRPLAEVTAGTTVRLARVTEEVEIDSDALALLGTSGFVTGELAVVVSRRPDGAATILVGASTVELSPRIAANLFVTVENETAALSARAGTE